MKVKELIEKLKELDQDKEIFIYTDWNYLQEDWTFFKLSYSFEDLELIKWYFIETKDEVLVSELIGDFTKEDIKEEIKMAKKYMKKEWYEKVINEWECYCFEAF